MTGPLLGVRADADDASTTAVLAFTKAIVETKGRDSDRDIEAARRAGLADTRLSDIVGHVVVNVLTNRRAFDVGVDFALIQPDRQRPAAPMKRNSGHG